MSVTDGFLLIDAAVTDILLCRMATRSLSSDDADPDDESDQMAGPGDHGFVHTCFV